MFAGCVLRILFIKSLFLVCLTAGWLLCERIATGALRFQKTFPGLKVFENT